VIFLQGHRGTLGDRYLESDIIRDEQAKKYELTHLRDKGVVKDFDVWRTGGSAFIMGTWYTSAYSYTHVNDSPACGEGYRRSVVLVPGRQEEYTRMKRTKKITRELRLPLHWLHKHVRRPATMKL
jgi:hypothetical protein